MRNLSETIEFVTSLLINDLNMSSVKLLKQGITVCDLTGSPVSGKNVIEIVFEDINKSDWYDILSSSLHDFIPKGQRFRLMFGDGDTMLIFLYSTDYGTEWKD